MVKMSGPIGLPQVSESSFPVEKAVRGRRSVRKYSEEPLRLFQVSRLLWAAQGLTEPDKELRAVPSAGATYPLEVFIVVSRDGVDDLEEGVYRYSVEGHCLEPLLEGDVSSLLSHAALGQGFVESAPASMVIAAHHDRTTKVYGERGVRYVHMEAGHAGQSIALQAVALGLSTVMVGAFDDILVKKVLGIDRNLEPLYIIPVGKESV